MSCFICWVKSSVLNLVSLLLDLPMTFCTQESLIKTKAMNLKTYLLRKGSTKCSWLKIHPSSWCCLTYLVQKLCIVVSLDMEVIWSGDKNWCLTWRTCKDTDRYKWNLYNMSISNGRPNTRLWTDHWINTSWKQ